MHNTQCNTIQYIVHCIIINAIQYLVQCIVDNAIQYSVQGKGTAIGHKSLFLKTFLLLHFQQALLTWRSWRTRLYSISWSWWSDWSRSWWTRLYSISWLWRTRLYSISRSWWTRLSSIIMKSDYSWSWWSGPSPTVELRAAPDAPVLQELLFQIAGEWRRGLRDNQIWSDLMLCPLYSLYTIHYNAHRISSLFIILHHSSCITTIIIILFQLSRRNGNSGGMLLPHLPQVAEIFSIDYLQLFPLIIYKYFPLIIFKYLQLTIILKKFP